MKALQRKMFSLGSLFVIFLPPHKTGVQMTRLTRRQQEIYQFLSDNGDRFEHPPTMDELCQALGLSSRGSLHKHITALVKAGLVEPFDGQKRIGIRLVRSAANHPDDRNQLPFVGKIAAGQPIEAIEDVQPILVPDQLKTSNSCYVLQVKGESMIEAGIFDGDWVVIEQRNRADNGDIVVALIDHNEATLKFFQQSGDQVMLIPANSSMQAMSYPAESVEIQGVLVGQMRSYR
jgi:repressor LexA